MKGNIPACKKTLNLSFQSLTTNHWWYFPTIIIQNLTPKSLWSKGISNFHIILNLLWITKQKASEEISRSMSNFILLLKLDGKHCMYYKTRWVTMHNQTRSKTKNNWETFSTDTLTTTGNYILIQDNSI